MTEGREEKVATACFGTVTARLQRLFRRLPKSQLGSGKLQALRSFCHEARLARGRSNSLQREVLRGCWGSKAFPMGKGVQEPPGSLGLNSELSTTTWPPNSPGTKAEGLPP